MIATIFSSPRTSPSLTLLLGLILGVLHRAVAEPTNFYKSVSLPRIPVDHAIRSFF